MNTFYKLMNNDIVMDILQNACYVRYLPKSKRWVVTDQQSAHGIMGSDHSSIYYLQGRVCPCAEQYPYVLVEEISEEEYAKYANEMALRKKENEQLYKKIENLEQTLANQTELLQQLLQKLK